MTFYVIEPHMKPHICIIIVYGQKFVNTVISQVIDSKQPGKVANTVSIEILIFLSVCSSLSLYTHFSWHQTDVCTALKLPFISQIVSRDFESLPCMA